jgi:hypothetical protein
MTIALGLLCRESVVLAADTEITGFVGKWQREKIRNCVWTSQIGIATVFAGTVEFALMACDKIFPRVLHHTTLEMPSILDVIEGTIREVYEGPVAAFPGPDKPNFSLLIGVRLPGDDFVHFIKTSDTAVRRADSFESIGAGEELARYLGSKLFRGGMPVEEGAVLAAYVLHEVKNNVVGCGGSSLILALQPNGMKLVSSEKLSKLENWFGSTRMPSDALPSKILKEFGPILGSVISSESQ